MLSSTRSSAVTRCSMCWWPRSRRGRRRVRQLPGTSRLGGEAVSDAVRQPHQDSRKKIADELEDLNKQLTFTFVERPASSGEDLTLRPFSAGPDRDIFATRTEDMRAAGDGSGGPAGELDDEIRSGLGRINLEDAAWLVAVVGTQKVGMVFGDLVDGEVNARIWIHPDHRKKGYGTAALRKARQRWRAISRRCRWSSAHRAPSCRSPAVVMRRAMRWPRV